MVLDTIIRKACEFIWFLNMVLTAYKFTFVRERCFSHPWHHCQFWHGEPSTIFFIHYIFFVYFYIFSIYLLCIFIYILYIFYFLCIFYIYIYIFIFLCIFCIFLYIFIVALLFKIPVKHEQFQLLGQYMEFYFLSFYDHQKKYIKYKL